jgi:hypothetical protein
MKSNITEVLKEIAEDLKEIDEILNKKAIEDENKSNRSILEKIAKYLQLENYDPNYAQNLLSGLSTIIKDPGSLESYRIGVLLVYLSENTDALIKLSKELRKIGY